MNVYSFLYKFPELFSISFVFSKVKRDNLNLAKYHQIVRVSVNSIGTSSDNLHNILSVFLAG